MTIELIAFKSGGIDLGFRAAVKVQGPLSFVIKGYNVGEAALATDRADYPPTPAY